MKVCVCLLRITTLEPSGVVHTGNTNYSGGGCRRIAVRGQPGQKCETIDAKQVKDSKGLGGGSKGEALA
jgi:hypothetical protein